MTSFLRKSVPLPRISRPRALEALLYLILALILFRGAVFGGRVFFERDIHLNWYGLVHSFVDAVGSGSWPLWDRFAGFGEPLLALPEAQVLYPLTWLNLLVRPGPYYTLLVVSHVVFSAIGAAALGRRLGLSARGSFVAGAIWMLSGPFLSLVNVYQHFTSAAWIPWVLLAAETAATTRRPSHALLWGVALGAQLLGGSGDMVAITVVLSGGCLLAKASFRHPAAAENRRLLAMGLLAGATGLALSAAQWVPTLVEVASSTRRHLPEATRTYFSLNPASLIDVLLPVRLNQLALRPEVRRALFEAERTPFLGSLYLGLPAFGLVMAAFERSGPRRLRWLLALVTATALLVALGRYTPVYGAVVTLLPFLKLFRYPSKAMIVAALGWALLAGMGHDAWARAASPGHRRAWIVRVPLLLALLSAGSVAIALVAQSGTLPSLVPRLLEPRSPVPGTLEALARRMAVAGLTGLGIALLASVTVARKRTRSLAVVASLLVLAELGLQHDGLNGTAPSRFFDFRPSFTEALYGSDHRRLYAWDYDQRGKSLQILGTEAPTDLVRIPEGWPARAGQALAVRTTFVPDVPAGWGLASSYDADTRDLDPVWLRRLLAVSRGIEGTPLHLRLLQIGAVSHVIAMHEPSREELEPVAVFTGFLPKPVRLFRVPKPLPRAYVVDGCRVASGLHAIETLLSPGFDPWHAIVLPEGEARPHDAAFSGRARIVELRADRVRIEVDSSRPAFAVLVDRYDAGWRATVDGQAASVLRANVAFRAVPVGAGHHVVELVYRPLSVGIGLMISALALLALGWSAVWSLRNEPPAPGAA